MTRWAVALLLALAPTLAGAVTVTGSLGGWDSSMDLCYDLTGTDVQAVGCFIGGAGAGPYPTGDHHLATINAIWWTLIDGVARSSCQETGCDTGYMDLHVGVASVTTDDEFRAPFTLDGLFRFLDGSSLAITGHGQYAWTRHTLYAGTEYESTDGAHGFILAVPEPSSLAFLSLSLVGLVAWRRR